MKHAVIRESDNVVVNIIIWDGASPWEPPEGHRVEEYDPAVHALPVPVQSDEA